MADSRSEIQNIYEVSCCVRGKKVLIDGGIFQRDIVTSLKGLLPAKFTTVGASKGM